MRSIFLSLVLASVSAVSATQGTSEYLVKAKPNKTLSSFNTLTASGMSIKEVGLSWYKVTGANTSAKLASLKVNPAVEYVQPNYKIHLLNDYKLSDVKLRTKLEAYLKNANVNPLAAGEITDNPDFPVSAIDGVGPDPLSNQQWGMQDLGVLQNHGRRQGPQLITAVIDTGVDYTHEDLATAMWRNPGESGVNAAGQSKATNGVDDDGNGYIDDVMGWDFAADDNKPYDMTTPPIQLLLGGGNPGHGTHCAGNVGAKSDNGKGIVGVADNTKIMALRFLTEKGQGTTEGAIKAIKYAVDNGAKVLSNSWGSEGEDPADGTSNQALRDVITYAQQHDVLFIAAAGNGHQGVGYDNDSDAKPGFPASYTNDNIISVAALDVSGQLGKFSNWGARSVDIGAPGVKVYSTVPAGIYQDTIDLTWNGIDIGKILGMPPITWDGTSMATPHVAGAASLYWSAHPTKTWSEAKQALMTSAVAIPSMQGKSTSNGKLSVSALMAQP